MASMVGDLFVVLRAETAPFRRSMADAAVTGESFTSKMGGLGKTMSKLGKATTLVGVGVAVASVKMASDFQAQMTRLQTAAGLTQQQLKQFGTTTSGLNSIVLKLGSQVGFTGTQMAEALYHPISAGLDLKSALEVVKYAAEEAKISGANLEDTTYSLSSVMKAFNQPASQAKQTMASLNAIVGQGDMRFQDFNQSVKNWAPTAAQMGISINSMGAGLAYLTDRGNSAEVAATRMTMGISMMTTPSKQAAKMLVGLGVASTDVKASSAAMQEAMQKAGITQNQLALDLKKPDGLYVALKDLKDGLQKAGVSGTEADSVLAKIFGGGRSDKAIMSLMQNLDGLKGKFNDISRASAPKNFDAAWQQTQQTFKVQMDKMKVSAENLGISLGLKLIPVIQKVLTYLTQHKAAAEGVATAIGVVLAGSVLKFVAGALTPLGKGLIGATKGLTNLARGFFSADAAASGTTGRIGSFGGILRKGFDAVAGGARTAAGAVAEFASGLGQTVAIGAKMAWDGLVSGLKTVGGALKTAALGALELSRNMITSAVSGLRAAAAWTAEKVALIASTIAEKAAAAAQWLLNVAMDANPIMLIVLALAALVGAIIYAYNHFTWFRNGVKAAWSAIVGAAKAAWDWLQKAFNGIVDGLVSAYHGTVNTGKSLLNWVEALPGRIYNYLAGLASHLYNMAATAWEHFKTATATKAVQMLSYVSGLPGRILSGLGNLGSLLYSAGMDVVTGLWHGIESMGSWLGDQIVGFVKSFVPGPVLKFLGISSPSKLFHEIGVHVTEGLAQGITTSSGKAATASQQLASAVAGGARGLAIGGGLSLAGAGGAVGAGGPTVVNYITVQGSVLTNRDIRDLVQMEMLRLGARSSTTYKNYER